MIIHITLNRSLQVTPAASSWTISCLLRRMISRAEVSRTYEISRSSRKPAIGSQSTILFLQYLGRLRMTKGTKGRR